MTQLTLPPIVLDFETFYDRQLYSLSRMNTITYVLDPRFEVICFAWQELHPDGSEVRHAPSWMTGTREQVRTRLRSLRLEEREVIAHNAMFEGAILEWQFGIRPARYLCTMMGARPLVAPFTGTVSLERVADFYEFERKGDAVDKFSGTHRTAFSTEEMLEYAMYCMRDVTISGQAARRFHRELPQDERDLIDLTIKKFTRPRLMLDKAALLAGQANVDEAETKTELLLAALNLSRIDVTSNPRFAMALQARGVTVPMKDSPTTGKPTFAFAKKDPGFIALRTHPDPQVQNLVEARLLLKSSIERTRFQQFLDLADRMQGRLPVPLMYYGAHTGRFSGLMGINLQNLPRGSVLRSTIRAPDGYKIVTVDLSAIEARITATLAGQWDLVKLFAEGLDVYAEFATDIYGYPVTADEATADERFIGKMCILGLGFGMGPPKFQQTLQSFGFDLPLEEATRIVKLYRTRYSCIPALWRKMDAGISRMLELPPKAWTEFPPKDPVIRFMRGKLLLPNGMPIFYPHLTRTDTNGVTYRANETAAKQYDKPLWGGALTENVVQALARIIISRAELRLARAGLTSVMQVHDELVFVVPEAKATAVAAVVKKAVTDPVPWMRELPLACKIGIGDTYGEAK